MSFWRRLKIRLGFCRVYGCWRRALVPDSFYCTWGVRHHKRPTEGYGS